MTAQIVAVSFEAAVVDRGPVMALSLRHALRRLRATVQDTPEQEAK